MSFQRAYGVAAKIRIPIVKAGSSDFAATGDWTPATGDVKISKDGGNFANVATLPVAIGGTGSVGWEFSFSATEMQAAEIMVQVIDSATKAVQDQAVNIQTYGAPGSGAGIEGLDAAAIGDAAADEVYEGTETVRQLLRLIRSALVGKVSGLAGTSPAFRDLADTKDRIAATVDADGNRTAVTTDAT